jgi:tetratricopeptide (TPR) repeat protein
MEADTPSKQYEAPLTSKQSVIEQLERLVLNLNKTAMELLKRHRASESLQLLQKALSSLEMTSKAPQLSCDEQVGDLVQGLNYQLLGLTHNNLGCIFKQQEDFEQALVHLKAALYYESQLDVCAG